ncbi:MAG TPA: L-seryl-tRNA(Sec) selenium transferase [Candidatus Binataceae bacterium]|nr:L-seryl-tRNA(Sec) selenium transferase [Candidatus Binataceae bacterium]
MAGKSRQRQRAVQSAPDSRGDRLRIVPPTDECLRAVEKQPAFEGLSRGYLKMMVQRAQAELREAIVAGRRDFAPARDAVLEALVHRVEAAVAADEPALKPVVNATGIILHTNLGRAILAEDAIEALEQAARSAVNLEYDLATGERGDRDSLVETELRALTGAEAATVVNNNAAAVLLALNTLAEGREVIVSRGELIEIGGSFRLPDIMARSGARLREVGTTNRTHPRDYIDAIGPDTALLLKVHPSNYRVVGFTSEVPLDELVKIGRERGLDVVEDLGAGALVDFTAYGLAPEPVVADRIAAGAALVTFSGDKLLGGPQAGLIAGRRELVERLRRNPLKRALRCDKLTLAALEATLRLYLRSADLPSVVPTLRLLRRTPGELRSIGERVRAILAERLGGEFQVDVVSSFAEAGSGSLPAESLESAAVRVRHPRMSPDKIAEIFRRARIIGRVSDRTFLLDMRTIEDESVFAVDFGRMVEK